MDTKSVLAELEALGTAQGRKIYARHGVDSPMFGVSFADLGKLQKRIKTDQALADGLWSSGNHDARVLACMVSDALALSMKKLDAWVKDVTSYVLADALSKAAAASKDAAQVIRKWIRAKGEWKSTAGWNLVALTAADPSILSDGELRALIQDIGESIHRRPNRTRYAMNQALISIGTSRPALLDEAREAAQRIGVVEVDHGETGCKTPDALSYMQKVLDYRAGRSAKKSAKMAASKAPAKAVKKAAKKAAKAPARRAKGRG